MGSVVVVFYYGLLCDLDFTWTLFQLSGLLSSSIRSFQKSLIVMDVFREEATTHSGSDHVLLIINRWHFY